MGCYLPGCCPSLTILVHPCSFIVGCHIAVGDVAPVSCVKKGGGGGLVLLTSTLPILLLVAMSLLATWPLLLVCEQRRGERMGWLTCSHGQ